MRTRIIKTSLCFHILSFLVLALAMEGDSLAQAIPNPHARADSVALPAPIRQSSRPVGRSRAGTTSLQTKPGLPNGFRPSHAGVRSIERTGVIRAESVQRLRLAAGEVTPDNELSAEAWEAEKARHPLTQFPQSDAGEFAPPSHSHQVIRAPRMVYGDSVHGGSSHAPNGTIAGRAHHHLPPLVHHSPEQAPPAVIPDASHREVWKSPFSYGYFGASGSRHWKRHYGYRDRDSEWRLR